VAAERIRLAHFSKATTPGDAEEHILTLLRGLDRTCFQPFLICAIEMAAKLGADLPADISCGRASCRARLGALTIHTAATA